MAVDIDRLFDTPPTCLQAFVCAVLSQQLTNDDYALKYALSCASCSMDIFQISGFPKVAPDPSPYFSVEPGQVFFRPPHRMTCVACGKQAPLFDIRTQGYDGALGHSVAYESGTGEDQAFPGHFRVLVSLDYHCLEELEEIAEETGVKVHDLFGWITVEGIPLDDGTTLQITYECS